MNCILEWIDRSPHGRPGRIR